MEEKHSTLITRTEADGRGQLQQAGYSDSRSPALQVLWTKLWRDKWLVFTFTAAFALIGLMLGALNVTLYRSDTLVEIQAPSATEPLQPYIQAQIQIIQSRSLVERTLAKFSEGERSRLFESPRFWWAQKTFEQNLESLRHHISVGLLDQAGVVNISLLSPDASAGAHFLNSFTQELADYNVERSWRIAQHNRAWTDRQLDDLRRKWDESEQIVAEYSQTAGMASTKTPAPALHDASGPSSPSMTSLENGDLKLRELKARAALLHKQIAQWEALYGASTARALKIKSELAETDAAIRQRRASLVQSSVAAQTSNVHAQSAALQSAAQRTQYATSHSEALAHFNVLKQEADTDRQIYESTASRLKESTAAVASHIGSVSVVDPAVADAKPATPNQTLYGMLGALAGLLFGIAFTGLKDRFSPTFSDPVILRRYLGLPVLGGIPIDRFADLPNGFTSVSEEPVLKLAFDTNLHIAEAYRSIRSSILLRASQRTGPRRLLFTSAGVSEGKTAVVGNLGAALAGAQRRVLLIDGDLRNPGLHKMFGTDNDHGLADLLSRQITASPVASRDVIRETQIPDLYLLSAGQAGVRAPEILSSAQLPQLIREFAKGFDIVLVDSAPVLPYADSRSLARAADGVVLIVNAAITNRRAALLARDAITQDGLPIVGAILTDWDRSRSASA